MIFSFFSSFPMKSPVYNRVGLFRVSGINGFTLFRVSGIIGFGLFRVPGIIGSSCFGCRLQSGSGWHRASLLGYNRVRAVS